MGDFAANMDPSHAIPIPAAIMYIISRVLSIFLVNLLAHGSATIQDTAKAVGVVSSNHDGPSSPNKNAEITPNEAQTFRLVTWTIVTPSMSIQDHSMWAIGGSSSSWKESVALLLL